MGLVSVTEFLGLCVVIFALVFWGGLPSDGQVTQLGFVTESPADGGCERRARSYPGSAAGNRCSSRGSVGGSAALPKQAPSQVMGLETAAPPIPLPNTLGFPKSAVGHFVSGKLQVQM